MAKVGLWIDWDGSGANERFSIYYSGTVTAGSFTLTFGAQTTSAIAWDATFADVRDAVAALSSVGAGNVRCWFNDDYPEMRMVDGFTGVWEFCGDLGWAAQATPTVSNSLTGGSAVVADYGAGHAPHAEADCTGDLMSIEYHRGGSPELTGQAGAGGATIVLENRDGRYTPDNASSPIYGYLEDGVKVWFGVHADGTIAAGTAAAYGRFAGRITDITPIPATSATEAPTVEINCEDAFGVWSRVSVLGVSTSRSRSQRDFRREALYWGPQYSETTLAVDLAIELTPLPVSYLERGRNALDSLQALNVASGTRHFIDPADSPDIGYIYTSRNRQYKLGSTGDVTLSSASDHLTSLSNWRLSGDTVINEQKVTAEDVDWAIAAERVWTYEHLPLAVAADAPFETVVLDTPVLSDSNIVAPLETTASGYAGGASSYAFNGSEIEYQLNIGGTATATYIDLGFVLKPLHRNAPRSYSASDTTSQARPRGTRAGNTVSGDYLGTLASAKGLADHIVWRYADPTYRPTVTTENWFDVFTVDLFDTVALTVSQLHASALVMEIVGLTERVNVASPTVVSFTDTLILAESRVQDGSTFFALDDSALDDATTPLAY